MATRRRELTPDLFEPIKTDPQVSQRIAGSSIGFWKDWWRRLKKNRGAYLGLVVIVVLIAAAYVGPLLSPYTPYGQDLARRFVGPSSEFWFGTDDFVRDLPTGPIQRVSVDSSENQANGRSFFRPSISSDSRYVAFDSLATNLDLDRSDTDTFRDVFVRDLQTQTTEMVSVNDSGIKGNGNSFFPSISADGRYVAFNSGASNLDADRPDTNNGGDVFVRDRQAGTTLPNDGIAPTTTHAVSPQPNANGWNNSNVTVTLSATDTGGSGVKEIRYSATGAQTISSTAVPGGSATVNITTEGTTTINYFATDNAGSQESPAKTLTVKLDKGAPKVNTANPANLTTGVARSTNATATFSEKMDPASITKATFKLYKCPSTTSTNCTKQVTNVTVSLSTDGLRATLNPYGTSSTLLASRTRYKAVVTTGTKDMAGNALDQDPSAVGNQQQVWYFTTGRT